jgi:hypothetical protein
VESSSNRKVLRAVSIGWCRRCRVIEPLRGKRARALRGCEVPVLRERSRSTSRGIRDRRSRDLSSERLLKAQLASGEERDPRIRPRGSSHRGERCNTRPRQGSSPAPVPSSDRELFGASDYGWIELGVDRSSDWSASGLGQGNCLRERPSISKRRLARGLLRAEASAQHTAVLHSIGRRDCFG